MAKSNVYSVICLDEYYNLGSFRTVFRFNHYINLVLKLNLSEHYLSIIYNNLNMTIDCYFEILGHKFKTSNNYLYIASIDRGSVYNNHSNLNTLKSIIQVIHNISYKEIEVGSQFTDNLGNNLKVIYNGDSNV